ncbi:MAG: DUF1761 domain-containing protein [Bacteroidetes bacterium]|nr:DUF1761 domain-containing protein [Bacteroidota bacterium]
MQVNFLVLLIAAVVPMIVGFIWYNPKTLGTAWMKAAEVSEDKMKGANMALIFGLSFVFAYLLAMAEQFMVIHQYHVYSIFQGDPTMSDPNSATSLMINDFMAKYGNNFRTFKHGALHGTIAGLFVALPIIGTNALFERKSFKYIFINAGYWTITLALMGGVICAFA